MCAVCASGGGSGGGGVGGGGRVLYVWCGGSDLEDFCSL